MARAGTGILGRMADRRALARWARLADTCDQMELGTVRALRGPARQIQHQVDRALRNADARLTLPRIGADTILEPAEALWSWRPELWRTRVRPHGVAAAKSGTKFDQGVKIFHDCPGREIVLRQTRNTHETDFAPFGLAMDIFHFEGAYLSVAIDLPDAAWKGLKRRDLLRIDTLIGADTPVPSHARLNLRHGPNVERQVRDLSIAGVHEEAEFDLGALETDEARIQSAWVEIIFQAPPMNRIVVRDVTISRRPRAEF